MKYILLILLNFLSWNLNAGEITSPFGYKIKVVSDEDDEKGIQFTVEENGAVIARSPGAMKVFIDGEFLGIFNNAGSLAFGMMPPNTNVVSDNENVLVFGKDAKLGEIMGRRVKDILARHCELESRNEILCIRYFFTGYDKGIVHFLDRDTGESLEVKSKAGELLIVGGNKANVITKSGTRFDLPCFKYSEQWKPPLNPDF